MQGPIKKQSSEGEEGLKLPRTERPISKGVASPSVRRSESEKIMLYGMTCHPQHLCIFGSLLILEGIVSLHSYFNLRRCESVPLYFSSPILELEYFSLS